MKIANYFKALSFVFVGMSGSVVAQETVNGKTISEKVVICGKNGGEFTTAQAINCPILSVNDPRYKIVEFKMTYRTSPTSINTITSKGNVLSPEMTEVLKRYKGPLFIDDIKASKPGSPETVTLSRIRLKII